VKAGAAFALSGAEDLGIVWGTLRHWLEAYGLRQALRRPRRHPVHGCRRVRITHASTRFAGASSAESTAPIRSAMSLTT
jgi:hypothetical protein